MASATRSLPMITSSRYEIDWFEERVHQEARDDFWAFRKHMHPEMLTGWWVQEVAGIFQGFYEDLVEGKRPKMILEAPPQHGKSFTVEDFLAWVAGKNPDLRSIFASYSEDLGMRTNSILQRVLTSEKYQAVFPATRVAAEGTLDVGRYKRNSSLIEFVGQKGSFRNTTVEGRVVGQTLDLGVVDDPMKGRAEANSPTIREKTWNWLMDDFFTRFSDQAGVIITTTRWHVDDPAGRFIEKNAGVQVHHYPALATEDEPHRKKGEPLFPEFKSKSFILERKLLQTAASFEAVYQGAPYVVGGGMFPIEQLDIISENFDKRAIQASVRYWDKAGTDAEDGAVAYTAGVLMHKMRGGYYIIENVRRGQWSALKRELIIKQTAKMDRDSYGYGMVRTFVEQEPGSGGKESAENTVRNLAGFSVFPDKVTGDKITRAEPYAAQVEGNNVLLVHGEWNRAFVDEHETFPAGKTKDMVDAAAGAFMKLNTGKETYDRSLDWVGNNVVSLPQQQAQP